MTKNEQERSATWPATQVGLRTVKSGLGGHDDGVCGVDDGVEKVSFPVTKRSRPTRSDCPTFSGFVGVEMFVLEVKCETTSTKPMCYDAFMMNVHMTIYLEAVENSYC